MLFLGGFILPILTGILLTIVEPSERTIANSIANLSYNLFGYLPAPFVYGLVCSLTGGIKSRYGMGVLMFATIFSFIFVVIALLKRKSATY